MKVPDELVEEFGIAIQMGRLWHRYPLASCSVEPAGQGVYRALVTVPGGPTATGHSETAIHALGRAFTHLGLVSDLTEYP